MGTAIGNILPLALGVAFSPVPIIAVILMMVSRKGKVNGTLFVLGWFSGTILLNALVLLFAHGQDYSDGSDPSLVSSLVKLLFGVLLIYVALDSFKKRPKAGEHAEMPAWMQALDSFSPLKALGLGAGLATINAKNLPTTISAATILAQENLSTRQTSIAVLIFAFIAALGVGLPVIVARFDGEKAQVTLNDWKVWLSDNNATIMFVLFLFLGLSMLGKGLGGLF